MKAGEEESEREQLKNGYRLTVILKLASASKLEADA